MAVWIQPAHTQYIPFLALWLNPLFCPYLSTRSRTIRNPTSARVSVPGLLREETSPDSSRPWKWRTDLAATKPFWENWFTGLSKKFLEARGGKLLLLAGTDRLDRELIIGQMQGL
jgi:protein phosphatase methylesterase 1